MTRISNADIILRSQCDIVNRRIAADFMSASMNPSSFPISALVRRVNAFRVVVPVMKMQKDDFLLEVQG